MCYEIERKYHWWSGYDLLRRLLFFVVYLMFENFYNEYTQVSISMPIRHSTSEIANFLP